MERHQKLWIVTPAALVVAMVAAGCSSHVHMSYFRQARDQFDMTAVPTMVEAQTMNPEAGKNRKVVAGLDSDVAKNIQDAYAKSFVKEQQAQGGNAIYLGLQGVGNN